MKRITLFLMAALISATTCLAQTGQQKVLKQHGDLPAKKVHAKYLQRQSNKDLKRGARKVFGESMKTVKANSEATTRAIGDELITKQPAGKLVSYVFESDAITYYFGAYQTHVSGGAFDVVFGENNSIYFKSFLSQYPCNGWIKGTINGSAITIDFPQPILKYGKKIFYAFLLNLDETSMSYIAEQEATLTLNYDAETGIISTPEGSDFATGDAIVGLCTDTGEWNYYSDWNMTLTPLTDEPVIAPKELETTICSITGEGFTGMLVNLGFQGDDVYMQGLYKELPDAWVKGTISDNKVVFKSGQYIGNDGSFHQYLMSANVKQEYDDYYEEYYNVYELSDEDIVFDYDPATKILSNSSCFLINGGKTSVNYTTAFNKAKVKEFNEVAATPLAPQDAYTIPYGYADYIDGYGFGVIEYDAQPSDVNGEFILPEKLSIAVWALVNGEEIPVTFKSGVYVNIEEDMTEIPYGFSDDWDFYDGGFYYYMTGMQAIGLQTIYRGGGEEHKSEITWVVNDFPEQPEKVTPTYPELDPANVGATITYSHYDGNDELQQIGDNVAQTYDVAMKIQDPALVGSHIDKISFPLMSTTGVSNIKAWLSTNLRVEGGQAVANLIEVPVENPEAGFITATLDKPYTIPEEGVYVGYSFTIDNLSDETNYTPIVALPGASEEGLFIHTTYVYLSWADISADANATAYIQVDISGSSITENAAGLKEPAITYVKTGEPYTVKVQAVNHGSNGITSLDIDYTINGTTTSKHFDLEEPVGGFFGTPTTVEAELPAIAEAGTYDLKINVTKVNGTDNGETAETTATVAVLNSVPKKRALLEEYTGTWCGWCIRGYVGLEKLAELYPDEYVLISYHNDDPMEIMKSSYFPSPISGFPGAWMDRMTEVDPYYGYDEVYGVAPLTIVDALNDREKLFGQADIALTASLTDNNTVTVNATATFPYDLSDSNYALEYVLVADGLTGKEGTNWNQSNYYSGTEGLDENLAPFGELGSSVPGLVFNDVAVLTSEIGGIEGSLPTTIKANEANAHTYKFDLANAVNTSGVNVIQDVNKLKVVAILIDTETGEVVNANKCVVVTDPTGIQTISEKTGLATERYNAAGMRISTPQKGLNIIRLANGKSIKVVVK